MSAFNYLNSGKQEGHPSADTFFRVSPSASPQPTQPSHLPGSAFAPPPQPHPLATVSGGTMDIPGHSREVQGQYMPAPSSGSFMQNAHTSGTQGGGSFNAPITQYQNGPADPQGPVLQRKRTKSAPRQGVILTGKQEHCKSSLILVP